MAFNVEEIKYKDDSGEYQSYNPKVFRATLTQKTPYLSVEKEFSYEEPTLQEVLSSLYAPKEHLIYSSMAMSKDLNYFSWEFIYNSLDDISVGKTYGRGSCLKIRLNDIDYIVVFLYPITITSSTDYNKYNEKTFIKLIPQPKS